MGSEGPSLVDFLEVSELIRKVLQYDRKSTLAIWEELKPPKTFIIMLKNQENKHIAEIRCRILGPIRPRFGPY